MNDTLVKEVDDYSERSVAFLDVLGFSSLVRAADKDLPSREVIRSIIRTLRETVASNPHYGVMFTQFSDCIVISAPRNPSAMFFVCQAVRLLSLNLLSQGYLLRGGIATGNLSHTDEGLFGTGLLEAYRSDRSGAPPRVTLDDQFVEDAQDALLKQDPHAIRQDPYDGTWTLHILRDFELYTPEPVAGKVVLDGAAGTIAARITHMSNDMTLPADVRAKWRWLREYWNQSVGVRGVLTTAP